jgi:hypothetical protein
VPLMFAFETGIRTDHGFADEFVTMTLPLRRENDPNTKPSWTVMVTASRVRPT